MIFYKAMAAAARISQLSSYLLEKAGIPDRDKNVRLNTDKLIKYSRFRAFLAPLITAALVCYHIFAEGVVAESAYFGFQKALTKAPWTRGMMMRVLFVMNCLANMPSVIAIVGAVHREHPGEFPFELDRQQLAREGVKQFWSRLKGVLFGKNAAAT